VFLRTLLVFIIIILFSLDLFIWKATALILLVIITFLDWFDGHTARRYNISSKLGGLLDTLGDRITENVLLIFFAYRKLVPLAVPVIFVSRSFVADLIRHLAHHSNVSTFEINKSRLGFIFVASRTSRVVYLLLKMAIFFLGGIILAMESWVILKPFKLEESLRNLRGVIFWGSIVLVLFNLIRFIFLLYDSQKIIKESFINTK